MIKVKWPACQHESKTLCIYQEQHTHWLRHVNWMNSWWNFVWWNLVPGVGSSNFRRLASRCCCHALPPQVSQAQFQIASLRPPVVAEPTTRLDREHQVVVAVVGALLGARNVSKEVLWEVKRPTVWTDGKAQPGRSSDRETVRSEKIRDEESQKWADAGTRKGSKVAKHRIFPMFCGSGRSAR